MDLGPVSAAGRLALAELDREDAAHADAVNADGRAPPVRSRGGNRHGCSGRERVRGGEAWEDWPDPDVNAEGGGSDGQCLDLKQSKALPGLSSNVAATGRQQRRATGS